MRESIEAELEDRMKDRFFCRRNLVCFEACSKCEVNGECFMCVSHGNPDKCQVCERIREPGEQKE